MTFINGFICDKMKSFYVFLRRLLWLKQIWLDFFEAINGRSATEEEIAAALAAGEFQDDAPAVETAPTQEAPAQPAFANVQETPAQEAQPQPTFAGAKKRNHSRLLRVHKTHKRKLLLQMLRQHNLNQPLRALKLLQYKEYQIKRRNHKLVLPMLKLVNKQLLLTLNLFNQVKTFNLSMVKL